MRNLKFKLLTFFLFSAFITSYELRFTIYELFAQESSKEEEAFFVAQKAFADGFYEVSLGLLERFLKNYPASSKKTEANLLIGECLFYQNKFLEALKKFEELLDASFAQDIKDTLYYWLGEVHFKGNNFSKASQYYKAVITDYPNSIYAHSAYYSLGWCAFQEQDYTSALNYFKILEDKFPAQAQTEDASFKLIDCLYNLKDYITLKEKVESYLKKYLKNDPKRCYLYFNLAEANYYLNELKEATEAYTKVTQNCSDERIKRLSKLGLGWTYLKSRQYPQAEEIFTQLKIDELEKKSQDALSLGKAILYFETNRFGEAQDRYDELMHNTQDPIVLLQAYGGKAEAMYNLAEYKEAIKTYQEALDKNASFTDIPGEITDRLHYGLAWAFLKEGEFKEAIKEFQKLVKLSEDKTVKVSALCQIGDAYQDAGDYQKAAETYTGILKDYPDSFYSDYVQYQLGMTLLKSARYDEAVIAFFNFQRSFADSKLLDEVSYALGLTYFQKQDYHSSKEVFGDFSQRFKESNLLPQAMYLLGSSLYNLAKYAEAIEAFKDILRVHQQDTELVQKVEFEIADCYSQLGNEKEAMERFRALRVKYPDSRLAPEVVWWLGEYYYRNNNTELARRYFSSLIQDFSKSSLVTDAYYVLGSLWKEESRYAEAIANFQKVVELSKSDLGGQASAAIADIYKEEKKLDLALNIYKETAQRYPNLKHLIYPKIADTFSEMKDYAQAIDYYRKSLEVVSLKDMAGLQFKLAEACEIQGNIIQAIEEYLKVTYLYAEDSNLTIKSLLRVGKIYEDKENFKEALNIYERIVSLNVPEAKYAQERIDGIRGSKKRRN